jgi:hypothetical protein
MYLGQNHFTHWERTTFWSSAESLSSLQYLAGGVQSKVLAVVKAPQLRGGIFLARQFSDPSTRCSVDGFAAPVVNPRHSLGSTCVITWTPARIMKACLGANHPAADLLPTFGLVVPSRGGSSSVTPVYPEKEKKASLINQS